MGNDSVPFTPATGDTGIGPPPAPESDQWGTASLATCLVKPGGGAKKRGKPTLPI